MLLDNGKFLTELHKLYEANKEQGSVWVTLKRSECSRSSATAQRQRQCHSRSSPCTALLPLTICRVHLMDAPLAPLITGNLKPRKGKNDYSGFDYHCLVRATDGERKLTTVVQGKELARFQDSYTTIMRVGLAAGHMYVPECRSLQFSWLHSRPWAQATPP